MSKIEGKGTSESPQFLIYQSEDGTTRVDVRLEEQSLWLSQKQLTELFGKAKGTISEHIKHVYEDGELEEKKPGEGNWSWRRSGRGRRGS